MGEPYGSEDAHRTKGSDGPRLVEVSAEELGETLRRHQKWVASEGDEGERANLRRADLRNAQLEGAFLSDANLERADLTGANLAGAFLSGANLRGAILLEASLDGARLTRTVLRDADLREADLTGVAGLLEGQLAGTDVSGAKLPEDIVKFEGLSHVEETSRNGRRIHLGMLLGCLYSWLTIATTTDVRLLTNSPSSPLPIIQTEIPIAGFYWAAPLILVGLYFYLHLYLQRLWDGLAKLPAVFPDGKAVHERAYPWLPNTLVRAHFSRLEPGRTLLSRFEYLVSVVLAWWLVPFTLLLFWLRYLPRHDWNGTALHVALLVVSVGAAILLHGHAVRTLRGRPTKFRWTKPWLDARAYQGAAALGAGVIFALISLGAIEGDARRDLFFGAPVAGGIRTWVPYAFWFVGYRTVVDLRQADVSVKPPNWTGRDKSADVEVAQVKGARLSGRNLRFADGWGAFLAKADLRGANLEGAYLFRANLQRADLTRANLEGAVLIEASLQGGNFDFANLQKATLIRANLKRAVLIGANLQGADLFRSELQGADLRDARGLTQEQLDHACGDEATNLPPPLRIEPCPEQRQAP